MKELLCFLGSVAFYFGAFSFGAFCSIKLGKWSAKYTAKERRKQFVDFMLKFVKMFHVTNNFRAIAQFERNKQFGKINKKQYVFNIFRK